MGNGDVTGGALQTGGHFDLFEVVMVELHFDFMLLDLIHYKTGCCLVLVQYI